MDSWQGRFIECGSQFDTVLEFITTILADEIADEFFHDLVQIQIGYFEELTVGMTQGNNDKKNFPAKIQ